MNETMRSRYAVPTSATRHDRALCGKVGRFRVGMREFCRAFSLRPSVERRSAVAAANSNVHWARPVDANGTGVLVMAGSSGRLDAGRADMLASLGVTALALRWFGGVAQPEVPREVPLETFVEAIDMLAGECERVVLMGLSYGAEAALLTASSDSRVDAVVAMAPSDVAWEGQAVRDDDPARSKWTQGGQPVAFVPLDRDWKPASTLPTFVDLYLHSRQRAGREAVEAATIPSEDFRGELVLVAGGDDKVWPSSQAAQNIAARRARFNLETTLVEDPRAGHPVVLPGETPSTHDRPYQVGGDGGAPTRLGALAWPAIRRALRLEDNG